MIPKIKRAAEKGIAQLRTAPGELGTTKNVNPFPHFCLMYFLILFTGETPPETQKTYVYNLVKIF